MLTFKAIEWGEESAVYLNRVEGEFAASDEDSVIPLSLIEKANERWQALQESSAWGDFVAVGADIARGGANKTALALRFAWAIKEIRAHSKKSTMETADLIQGILNYYGGAAIIDTIGVGAGVYDKLRLDESLDIRAFTASQKTGFRDRTTEYGFADTRSAAWWNMRELLQYEDIALPIDDILTGRFNRSKVARYVRS